MNGLERDRIYIELRVRVPWHGEEIRSQMVLDAHTFESFAPLPIERELPKLSPIFALFNDVHERTEEQLNERQRQGKHVAQKLFGMLLEIVQSRDTTDGYSPEEWKRIQGGGGS